MSFIVTKIMDFIISWFNLTDKPTKKVLWSIFLNVWNYAKKGIFLLSVLFVHLDYSICIHLDLVVLGSGTDVV